ncbi:MAG TPA: flagellar basal body rod protein FlgF [Stellaceae bacterium]|nr:flagellar basal body rod protein FlgF [Stellaceae bacterium]
MSQQMFYLAMTGLSATMDRMTAAANNLANASTTAFKAQRPVLTAQPLYGQGLANRVNVSVGEDTADFKSGPIEQTGRPLDVAVKGQGWIAVQAPDGSIALTRNGSLSVAATGVLQTSDGHPVLGSNYAPITLPPLQTMTIGQDGTISGSLVGQSADQISTLGRIALTNPSLKTLQRRADGLFADPVDARPPVDAKVQLQIGALEGSNANPIALMMTMIENTRMFQMQTELVRTVSDISRNQGTPLSLT